MTIKKCDRCNRSHEVTADPPDNLRVRTISLILKQKVLKIHRDYCGECCKWIEEQFTTTLPTVGPS